MRYIVIPTPIQAFDPTTDTLIVAPDGKNVLLWFHEYVRAIRGDERFLKGVDQIEAYESTASLIKASPGTVVPLQDATWSVLAEVARAPRTLAAVVIYSPGTRTFTEAITLASDRAPDTRTFTEVITMAGDRAPEKV
jgi:hypothetical protein